MIKNCLIINLIIFILFILYLRTQPISLIVDFNKPSQENRFYIKCHNITIYKGLVQHGFGGTEKDPKCSNEINSNKSCYGTFKILELSKTKNYNLECFRLQGLDSTNNNAYIRGIVIHYGNLPTRKFAKNSSYLPLSIDCAGCFSISWFAMQFLKLIYNNNFTLNAYYDTK